MKLQWFLGVMANRVLHWTAFSLRSKAADALVRYAKQRLTGNRLFFLEWLRRNKVMVFSIAKVAALHRS